MANFIDASYFKGEILLTNKSDSNVNADLGEAIARYEKEILISLLGYKLYTLVVANHNDEPYKSLIEGAEFDLTFAGITQTVKWIGFQNAEKESLIAYYTYYKYIERTFTKPSAINVVKPEAENAVSASPIPKMVNAWNEMVYLYGYFPITKMQCDYDELIKPTGNEIYNYFPSAFNYLSVNIADFPDWIFKPIQPINPFLI